MTCKDCIHYEVCDGYVPTDLDKDIWDLCVQGKSDEIPYINKRCSSFKDKSRFIEPPPYETLYDIDNFRELVGYKLFDCDFDPLFTELSRRSGRKYIDWLYEARAKILEGENPYKVLSHYDIVLRDLNNGGCLEWKRH